MSDNLPADDVWRARLARGLEPPARALNDSLPVDRRLWREELALSHAYGLALSECGILSAAELKALLQAAHALRADLEAGTVTLHGEDVHSAVEAELKRRCGVPALKLHTGRSRNDQVATLLRIHVMRLCDEAVAGIRDLERALLHQAVEAGETAVAACTHLQPAQPVLLAHLWLAHLTALERDETRFQAAREASDLMPLGAGAVAGTSLRYDRLAVANRLGFTRVATNSVDAVGDRDFALEYLHAASAFGIHLSRLAEDLVLWCSPGFGWLAPPDGYSTGSSLLPQKRNPDLFELARAKSARLLSNAGRLATVLKGLPSSYQKDLQEDKEAVFDTADTLGLLFGALPPAIRALSVRPEKAAGGLSADLLAVELADDLVAGGIPFRDAHALVGRLWAAAEAAAAEPRNLPDAARRAISPLFTAERLASLSVMKALARRNHAPGTGPEWVAHQIARAGARLGMGPGMVGEASSSGHRRPLVSARDVVIRKALPADIPEVARLMAAQVSDGTLLPRPMNELYQSVREFHVATIGGGIVACAALKLLWEDLGEVRSLVVAPELKGQGIGRSLVERLIVDARELRLARVIALTREVPFFEKLGFTVISRDTLPRKVWTDCVNCPRRHACDETAVVFDLVPGATEKAMESENGWILPLPPPRRRAFVG